MSIDEKFRAEIAADIRQIADLLERELLVLDTQPLRSAESSCYSETRGKWSYAVERLVFRELGKGLKIAPIFVNESDITLEFSFRVRGNCAYTDNQNPFEEFEFNIHIFASYLTEEEDAEICSTSCSWHLDMHINDDNNSPTFMHPTYHFQHGGRITDDFHRHEAGPVMVIDTPRLMHPPMDAILGIDFILTNFFNDARIKSIRSDGQYRNIQKRAQDRIWKPYFLALASFWNPTQRSDGWQATDLLPQLKFDTLPL